MKEIYELVKELFWTIKLAQKDNFIFRAKNMTSSLISQVTNTNNIRKIKPIPYKQRVIWTSQERMIFWKKKGYKIKSLMIPSVNLFFKQTLWDKIFIRPKTTFFKSQKTLICLLTCEYWLVFYYIFFPLQNVMRQLRIFSVGINPYHFKRKKLKKMLLKMKCLLHFEDLNRYKIDKTKKDFKVWPFRQVCSYKFSQNLNLNAFPALQFLSIDIKYLIRDIKLPVKLKEITLIDQEPLFRGTGGVPARYDNIIKNLNQLENLKKVNINFPFKDYYKSIFEVINLRGLTIKLSVDIGSLVDSGDLQNLIKGFVERTKSKVIIIPRNRENDKYMQLLTLLEQKSNEYNNLFYMENLSFNFHSQRHIQDRIIEYYKNAYKSVNVIDFSLSTNSLDFFTTWRKDNWKKIISFSYEKAKEIERLKLRYTIEFVDSIQAETLDKMIDIFTSLIEQNNVEKETIEKKDFCVELIIKIDTLKNERGLIELLTKSLNVSKKIDFLSCDLNKSLNDQYNKIAKVLRIYKRSGILKHFVLNNA